MNKSTPLNNQWAKMMVVVMVILALIANVKGQCSPDPSCNDGDACTIDMCEGSTCSNIPKSCDDFNPCTIDTCENGNCINAAIPNCIPPSFSPTASVSREPSPTNPSTTRGPIPVQVTPTSTPQVEVTSATPSRVVIRPSSASPIINISPSPSGPVPTGFPIQSASPDLRVSVTPSKSLSLSATVTATVSASPSVSQIPSLTATPSVSVTVPPPSVTPSNIPASPLPFRVGAPDTILVQLLCSGDCCSNFTGAWADLVDINSEYLMDLLTCEQLDSNLVSVTYNQFGSNFYNLYEILHAYWVLGGCGSFTFDQGEPCYPNHGYLASSNWESVVEIAHLTGDYLSTFSTDFSTDLTYITQPALSSTSSASFLLPSFFLLFSFFLF